ncbi:hypothetical protein [uncultured Sphingomonas sp.]|uniref:hypothetical protein n=1 Tax=uncultured Sphingomonas sp. TaxID=158754 RepID=UPI0025D0AB85|nr:hypothetical protein [uncultured Sphingomonas sp.]
MKYDPFSWDEVKPNEEVKFSQGRLRLQLSAPAALFITCQGVEGVASFGAFHDVEVSEEVTFRVEGAKGLRVFMRRSFGTSVEAEGEVYTNADRMPFESGVVAEVTRARRQLELERRAMLKEIRTEAAIARASLRAEKKTTPQKGGVQSADVMAEAEAQAEAQDDTQLEAEPAPAPVPAPKGKANK